MPTKNITIDNICPLINYSPVGAWAEGNTSDPFYAKYSNGGTFTLSVNSGASATFSFNGTGIWLFGAKRGNHDLYNVTLDGQTSTMNGSAPGDGIFQTPLFGQTGLENTLHNITLTNAGIQPDRSLDFLDLDFITWESTIGTDSEQAKDTTVQDSDPSFSYQPYGLWNTNPQYLNNFFGQSGHATNVAGASALFTFAGDAVQIYGTSGPNDAPYSVQVDGGSPSIFNATKYAAYEQVLIYYADNLGPGSHNVKITNQPALSGQSLNINYALVESVPSVPSTSSSSSGLGRGAIAGIVIGVLLVISILISFLLFLLRRKKRHSSEEKAKYMPRAFTGLRPAAQAVNFNSAMLSHRPLNPNSMLYSGHAKHPSTGMASSGQSDASTVRSPGEGSSSGGPSLTNIAHAHHPRSKGASVPQLSTAGQSLTHIPNTELLVNRMNVEGRPQDMGHVPVEGEMPPPDYDQATEQYDTPRV